MDFYIGLVVCYFVINFLLAFFMWNNRQSFAEISNLGPLAVLMAIATTLMFGVIILVFSQNKNEQDGEN